MKKMTVTIFACALCAALALSGCGSTAASSSLACAPAPETKPQDKAILVVSFGTSYNESRDRTIGAIENAIQTAFPEYETRRAFTSQIIIDKLAKRDNLVIDNVEQALDRAVSDGIKTLVVQPTHLMKGYEYTDLVTALEEYQAKFEQLVLAQPLLTAEEDFNRVIGAITAQTAVYDDGKTAICFMGHGTEANSNGVYAKMQKMLTAQGHTNYYVGTVEATPTLEELMCAVKAGDYTKVVLEPLMVVAGDHANNDMAGDDEDSWKSQFEAAGYEVECVLRGLGEFTDIQSIYVSHTQAAIDSLTAK
ncbi:MAG: sirohydrochlorin cobaltochelatase [Pygmaiobacter sp.]